MVFTQSSHYYDEPWIEKGVIEREREREREREGAGERKIEHILMRKRNVKFSRKRNLISLSMMLATAAQEKSCQF
jgi:hypothetical protein